VLAGKDWVIQQPLREDSGPWRRWSSGPTILVWLAAQNTLGTQRDRRPFRGIALGLILALARGAGRERSSTTSAVSSGTM
jgi:hypothetical protein